LRKTKVKLATHMGHVMRMYLRHEGKNQHIKDLTQHFINLTEHP